MRRGRIIIFLLLFVGACAGAPQAVDPLPEMTRISQLPVQRFIDEKAGVVCWLYEGYGISCLDIDVTDLERP